MVDFCKRKGVAYLYFYVLFGIYGGQQRYGKDIFVLAAHVPARAVFNPVHGHSAVIHAGIVRRVYIGLRNGFVLRVFAECVAVQIELQVAYLVPRIVIIGKIHRAFQRPRLGVVGGENFIFAYFGFFLFAGGKRNQGGSRAYYK